MAAFKSPLWDIILGLSGENVLVRDLMGGYCYMGSGVSCIARAIPSERLSPETMDCFLAAMRDAKRVYATKGVPLNTE